MAGQPTQPAKVILNIIEPCYHNFVFILETAEMAQYLNYIFILPCNTVNFFIKRYVATNNSIVEENLEVYRSSASADIRMNFVIRIRNISCGCHADIANKKKIF